jgi:hypothetical protein
MEVDGNESLRVRRQALELRPEQSRKAHDPIPGQRLTRDELEASLVDARGVAGQVQVDPVLAEQLPNRLGRGRAEQLERSLLGRNVTLTRMAVTARAPMATSRMSKGSRRPSQMRTDLAAGSTLLIPAMWTAAPLSPAIRTTSKRRASPSPNGSAAATGQ